MDYFGENLSRVQSDVEAGTSHSSVNKTYRVDAFGFLVDPSEWDEEYAENKAREMKIPGGLTGRHKELIQYLRRTHSKTETVPSVSECLEELGITMEEIERLFPDGYVRGAVKIAGLSMR
jgi:tRNA 2-thiouridine synthesizing protein E